MIFKTLNAIKWVIVIGLVLGAVVVYLAVTGGGDSFRWAGKKTEETGKSVRERLEKTADRADQIEEAADKAAEKLKELKEKIP